MNYDIVVLGTDPAGLATARHAANRRLCVGLVNDGPDPLDNGPLRANVLDEMIPEMSAEWLRSDRQTIFQLEDVRCELLRRAEHRLTSQLDGLRAAGVDVIDGQPQFLSNKSICVQGESGDEVISADAFVIATGSTTPGSDSQYTITAGSALLLESPPQNLAVVGWDRVAFQLATVFALCGSQVTVIDGQLSTWPQDDAAFDALTDIAMNVGVEYRLGAEVISMESRDHSAPVVYLDNGQHLGGASVLTPVMPKGNTHALGLSNLDLLTDERDCLWCDQQYRTWDPSIFGVGEVVGFGPDTISPDAQGIEVIDSILRSRWQPQPLGLARLRERSHRFSIGDDTWR